MNALVDATSSDSRSRILEAALVSFLEAGYEQTTVARIRDESHVSNGTLFHYFPTKEAIADALYLEAIADFQAGLWRLLGERPRSLRGAVHAVIGHQVNWIEANVDRARFVYTRGTLDGDSAGSAGLGEMNRRIAEAYQAWLRLLVDQGKARPVSMLMLTAIVTGPTHAIAKRWLAGHLGSPLHSYIDELTDAATAALSGRPSRPRTPSPARQGRVHLELVSDEGSVIGRAEATAEIIAVRSRSSRRRS